MDQQHINQFRITTVILWRNKVYFTSSFGGSRTQQSSVSAPIFTGVCKWQRKSCLLEYADVYISNCSRERPVDPARHIKSTCTEVHFHTSPKSSPPSSNTLEITPSVMDLSRSVISVNQDAASHRGAGDRCFGTCYHLSASTVASQKRLSQLIQSVLQTRQRKTQSLAFYILKVFSHSLFLRVLLRAIFITFHL